LNLNITARSNSSFRSSYRPDKILELATRHKIPAIYPSRVFTARGGLMSYDSDSTAVVRQILASHVGKILKGAKPADLPVQQPTTFDLSINRTTAKALKLSVPRTLAVSATELID
jgi:putative tryptophan/tyrosine transport system substrate-binding protein